MAVVDIAIDGLEIKVYAITCLACMLSGPHEKKKPSNAPGHGLVITRVVTLQPMTG